MARMEHQNTVIPTSLTREDGFLIQLYDLCLRFSEIPLKSNDSVALDPTNSIVFQVDNLLLVIYNSNL